MSSVCRVTFIIPECFHGWLVEVIKHIVHLTYDQWTHHIFPHEQGKDGLKRNDQYQKRRKMMLQQDMGDTGLRKEDKNLV